MMQMLELWDKDFKVAIIKEPTRNFRSKKKGTKIEKTH